MVRRIVTNARGTSGESENLSKLFYIKLNLQPLVNIIEKNLCYYPQTGGRYEKGDSEFKLGV